jgi:hypothetical protein
MTQILHIPKIIFGVKSHFHVALWKVETTKRRTFKTRFIRRISVASNAIQTIDNEA